MDILETKNTCPTCIYNQLLFSSLTKEELALISLNKREILFNKGEILFREGDDISEFMYLKSGLVKLFKTSDTGKQQIINISRPGDFVSLLSIFSEKQYLYSIMALERTVVCTVDIDVFKKMVETNRQFSNDVLKKMSTLYDEIIETKFAISKKHLRGRIAHILLMFAHQIYGSDEYELPVSRKEIAELIDMTTENVIRILSEFRKDKLIDIEGKKIAIRNKEMLQTISKLG